MPRGIYERTPEIRKRMGDFNRGKHLSDATKKKLSVAKSGEKHWNYGKHLTDEHKKKLSESGKGKHNERKNGDAYKRFKQKKKEILKKIKENENEEV